jgi:purine-binding chemotaxis protein CheW
MPAKKTTKPKAESKKADPPAEEVKTEATVVEETPVKEETKPEAKPEPTPEPAAAKEEDKSVTDVKKEAEAERAKEKEETDMSDALQVVVFNLAEEEYAVPILDVQEIIPTGEITPFPNVADYIEGIINVRGTVATIINLAKRFSLARKDDDTQKDKYIILTHIQKSLFGMMVDEVTEVTKIARADIKGASGIESKVHTDYISGVAVVGERVILILDFSKIINAEDIQAAAMHS